MNSPAAQLFEPFDAFCPLCTVVMMFPGIQQLIVIGNATVEIFKISVAVTGWKKSLKKVALTKLLLGLDQGANISGG